MPVYSITCPDCKTALKTSKPIPQNTILDCPKCGVMFPAPAPQVKQTVPASRPGHDDVEVIEDAEVIDDAEVIEDVEVIDEEEGFEVVEDEPKKPRRARAARDEDDDDDAPRPKKKPRPRRKRSNNNLVIGIAVAVGVVVLLGGAGFLAYKLLSGGGDALAYMPSDTTVVAGIKFGALSQE